MFGAGQEAGGVSGDTAGQQVHVSPSGKSGRKSHMQGSIQREVEDQPLFLRQLLFDVV